MQPERKRERLGSSFFALSRREHKAESNGAATESIGSALSNERTTEREKEEEEWRTWREERRGKDASGRPFSAPRFNTRPSKTLSLSLSLLSLSAVALRCHG